MAGTSIAQRHKAHRAAPFDTSFLASVSLVFLAAWLIWNWTQTIESILRFYTPLPVADYWRPIYDLAHYKTEGFSLFLRQHNEHRIIFPEVVYVLDAVLWRGRLILPLAVSFLCYLCTYLLLAATVLRDREISVAVRWTAILLAGIILGWKGSTAVLATPFQLQWTIVELAAIAAFAAFAQLQLTSRTVYLAGTIVAGVIATYSSGDGMVLWPLLVAAGLLLKVDRRKVLALAIAGAISIGVYFIGYNFQPSNFPNVLLHPFYTIGFIASYLSMPFGGMKSPGFGVAVGLANLALAIWSAVIAARRRLLGSPQAIVFFGWYLFTLGTVLLTAGGRMSPGDPFFSNAKPARYITVPLVTWGVLISSWLWIAGRRRWKVAPAAIALVFAGFAGVGFIKLRSWFAGWSGDFANAQATALSVQDGLRDPLSVRKIFPDPEFVFVLLNYLQQHRLSVFATHRSQWVGQPASTFAKILPGEAAAQISYVFPVRGGLEVVGWADTSGQRRPLQWLLFTNEKGEIAGFGRKLPAGFPDYLRAANTAYSLGWVGFVNFEVRARSYSAYLIEKAGLVPIDGSFSAPPVAAVQRGDLGPTLPDITWQADPSWRLNGDPPHERFDPPPPGRIFDSWNGSDSKTGQIVSSAFVAPANGCMILPVLHGPNIEGQSVEIRDAESGNVLVRAPMQNEDLQWEFWRFSLPKAAKRIQIAARDQGHAYGQWVGIADVTQCR